MALKLRKPKEFAALAVVELPAPPAENSPAFWEAKIREVVTDQARMKARQAEIETEIAARYGEDNEALETEYARLNARYNASGKVIEQYQQSEREAVKAKLLATFGGEVERFSALVTELIAYEAGEWLETERAYHAAIEKRRALRGQINQIQHNAGHQLDLAAAAHFQGDNALQAAISAERERLSNATPMIRRDDGQETPAWQVIWKMV